MAKKKDKISLDKQLNEKLLRSGKLFIHEAFTRSKTQHMIAMINGFNLLDKEEQPEKITISISSEGGEIYSLIPLLSAIEASEIPVWTVVDGLAASCGCALLMAGHKRFATAGSQIMSHQWASGASGKSHELHGRYESFKMMDEWMIGHYEKFTGLSKKKIQKDLLGPTDVWLSPKQALKFNIIDEVL